MQPAVPYHDIVTGDNIAYLAKPGWDYPTGWGTPDVANLFGDILMAKSPYWPWINNQPRAGGSPPGKPWYQVPHNKPLGAAAAPKASTLPSPARGMTAPTLPSPASGVGTVRAWAPSFMALVTGRLMTFLR
jgi:hypothetical protein